MLKRFQDTNTSLFTAAQIKELDNLVIQGFGIAGIRLMKRAAKAVVSVVEQQWPEVRSMTIFCGKGNNAGDGYVVAGIACNRGWQVQLLQVADASQMSGDAATARDWAKDQGVNAEPWQGQSIEGRVIVDALLGTGIRGQVNADMSVAMAAINSCQQPVVSVDIPSGLSADTGAVLGTAVHADVTVTFIGGKRGLITGQGPDYCGQLWLSDLDIPDAAYSQVTPGLAVLKFSTQHVNMLLKPRLSAHKGDFGHVVIIGGDYGYGGAAILAAQAAMLAGAGMVTLVTRDEHLAPALARHPEIMVRTAKDQVSELIEQATVVVCGPGLGQYAWGYQLFILALQAKNKLLLDADALNFLAGERQLIARLATTSADVILTPHPGEAARLLQCGSADIMADRYAAVQNLTASTKSWLVLKGAGSVLGAPQQGCIGVCAHGNPGMATAGMGDVLSGLLAGLWGQGLDTVEALKAGVCVHSAAADQLALEMGRRGVLASAVASRSQRLLYHC